MKFFKYWVLVPRDRSDESTCVFIQAPDQDSATRISEKVYPRLTTLKVREIEESDLPAGQEWL